MMLLRSLLFQLHGWLGMTAGLVLAVMGVTGAMMSFEPEILRLLNRDLIERAADTRPSLSPIELVQRIQAQRPDASITFLVVQTDPKQLSRVNLRADGERETHFLDRTNGRLLGEGRGRDFFDAVMRLHRWLALPGDGDGFGRQITGFAALSLVFFALSGLYLRWPRKPLDWRSWLVLDFRRSGRNLYRMLHAVVGGWVFIFYLLSATTGLYWSYDWYRDGVQQVLVGAGATAPRRPAGSHTPDMQRAWATFEQRLGGHRYETLTIAVRNGGTIEFRGKLPGGRHDRVTDELAVDAVTGAPLKLTPYADRPLGQALVTGVYELHRGAWFGLPGRIGVMIAALSMPLFTITGLLLYVGRRRRKRTMAPAPPSSATVLPGDPSATIIAFASQTGTAERIARLTAQTLPNARLMSLGDLGPASLEAADQLLIIASTYGEGEPPDMAKRFARRMEQHTGPASGLRYAVLALGDREYPDFCGFGRRLDAWLQGRGAERLHHLIQMDGDDVGALEEWRAFIRADAVGTPGWAQEPMGEWRLAGRRLLNPGSFGGPAWQVVLEPVASGTVWSAGDIIEVMPCRQTARADCVPAPVGAAVGCDAVASTPGEGVSIDPARAPLSPRAYSIASLSASGQVELLIRQHRADDGSLGLASGWLTDMSPIGGMVEARIRNNPAFQLPTEEGVPLILIGNGTGLAGLLAHIRHRATCEAGGPVWLILGERHPDHDAFHARELEAMIAAGVVHRLDRAWSRLHGAARYVQDVVERERDEIVRWVDAGATIMVCGSAVGMASAVDEKLAASVGQEALERLSGSGRYRRDIY